MMLFAIVFGLSMDYEVFLLSADPRALRPDAATTRRPSPTGSQSTARVITAAALIMVFVFGSFVVSDVRALKLIGLGLAVAVAIDASDRAGRPRAGHDGAARRRELVAAPLARQAAAPDQRRRRHRARSTTSSCRCGSRSAPVPDGQSSASSGGKPPVAIGPHRSMSMRMMHFPCRTIAARYSSQSECSPEIPRK